MMSNTLHSRIIPALEIGGDARKCSLELNSHVDLSVIGSEALIIYTHDQKVKVNEFIPELGSKTVDEADAALAYECEFTCNVSMMIVRNTLYLKNMKYHLLSPFIMRLVEVEVNEQPKFITRNSTKKYHLVSFPDDDLRLPQSKV